MITEVTWYKAIHNSLVPCDKLSSITAHSVLLNVVNNDVKSDILL
ncbi:unnamed protein product, partial [Staurois parvus]